MAEEEKISSESPSRSELLRVEKSESIFDNLIFDDFPSFNCTELIDVDVLEKQIDIADLVSYFQAASNQDENTTSKFDFPETSVDQEAKIVEFEEADFRVTETNVRNQAENTTSAFEFRENSMEQETNIIDFQGANGRITEFTERNISSPVVNFFLTPIVEKETKLESVEAVEGKGNK